jgi:hypothetical protein
VLGQAKRAPRFGQTQVVLGLGEPYGVHTTPSLGGEPIAMTPSEARVLRPTEGALQSWSAIASTFR